MFYKLKRSSSQAIRVDEVELVDHGLETLGKLQNDEMASLVNHPNYQINQMASWKLPESRIGEIKGCLEAYIESSSSKTISGESELIKRFEEKLTRLSFSYGIKKWKYTLLASLTWGRRRKKYLSKIEPISFTLKAIESNPD
jgi:hypothetical protein